MINSTIKYIWLSAFVILIVGVILWLFLSNRDIRFSSKPDFIMDAKDLSEAFKINQAEANNLYLNKIISVSGIVESISEDSMEITVYLKEKDAVSGVICSFDRDTDVSGIMEGTRVQIKGRCTGFLLDVILNKCSIEKQFRIEDIQHPAGVIPYYFATFPEERLKYIQSV
jgi:hypothetical protein